MIEQRPQHRDPSPSRLPEERVEVGKQPVAQPQELVADRLDTWTEDPWLMALTADLRVTAAEGRQGAELHPAGEEFAAGVACEAANVSADEGHSRQAHVQKLRHRHLQVLPPGVVVAHPASAPALHTREARTGEHERPLVAKVS